MNRLDLETLGFWLIMPKKDIAIHAHKHVFEQCSSILSLLCECDCSKPYTCLSLTFIITTINQNDELKKLNLFSL